MYADHVTPQKYFQVLRRCLLGQQTQRLKLRIQRVRVTLMCLVTAKLDELPAVGVYAPEFGCQVG